MYQSKEDLAMQKEITKVARDECPLDVIAKLGNRTEKAWIFLHVNVVHKLHEEIRTYEQFARCIRFTQNATDDYPATSITIGDEIPDWWKPVYGIEAKDIAFKEEASDPDEIFFLKMEE